MANTGVEIKSSKRLSRDFRWLWGGQSASFAGSAVSEVAMPLIAVVSLRSSPAQLGFLVAVGYLPFLFALPIGAWVDSRSHRQTLLQAHVGRGVILLVVACLDGLGLLRLGWLYAAILLTGTLTVAFDSAFQAYIPTLVEGPNLLRANSCLAVSETAADLGGPGLGGILFSAFGGVATIGIDAGSYLVAAVTVLMQPRSVTPQVSGHHDGRRRHPWKDIQEGLRTVYGNAVLRALAAEAATYNLAYAIVFAALALFAVRDTGLSAALFGIILSIGGVGAFVGAAVADRVARRFGLGRMLIAAALVGNAGFIAVALAGGGKWLAALLIAAGLFVDGLGSGIATAIVSSIRQAAVPARLRGRATASTRVLTMGALPLGALIGAGSGALLGVRATLLLGAVVMILAVPWLCIRQLRDLRELPDM